MAMLELYLIRHGVAEERGKDWPDDSQRPLTPEGIERLWEASMPLLDAPPPVRMYAPGSWGPNAIHQLIAPHAWRLPFERGWRTAD